MGAQLNYTVRMLVIFAEINWKYINFQACSFVIVEITVIWSRKDSYDTWENIFARPVE